MPKTRAKLALDYLWEGKTLAGWLSGFRAQTGYVACDVIRCLGEAAAPGGGELRYVPRLCTEYPGICLTTGENHGNTQSGYSNGAQMFGVECHSFVHLATASGRLDWSAVPCRH